MEKKRSNWFNILIYIIIFAFLGLMIYFLVGYTNQEYRSISTKDGVNLVVNSQDITVYHDSNGDASIYVGGSINTSFVMSGNCGGTIYLPKIDRNAPSISLSIKSIAEETATFNYSTNSTLDSLQGRLNSGNWQNISMNNPITLSNLSDDTNYTYQIRGKKASNQIWGSSNTISFKTVAGTFAMVSVNGATFKDAEIYIVTENSVEKISKDQYEIIEGDDS